MTPRPAGPFLLAITFVIAACSILYELLIAQTIALLAGNTVVWYSITIGLYLGAMGMGARYSRRALRDEDRWASLFRVELSLAVAGASAPLLLHAAHIVSSYALEHGAYLASIVSFFGPAILSIVIVGLISGIELPLLIRIGNEESGGNVTNRILGTDYLGSLVGAVSFPLLLLPRLEVLGIAFAVATLNAIAAMLIVTKTARHRGFRAALALLAVVVTLGGLAIREPMSQYFLRKYYYYQYFTESLSQMFAANEQLPFVERYRSPYQQIDIVPDFIGDSSDIVIDAYSTKYLQDPSFPRGQMLFLNGERQVYSNFEEMYHEYLAHVPIQAAAEIPQRVLVLGGGDGILVRELLKYKNVQSITLVDIDAEMVRLANSHPVLLGMNKGALQDARVEVIVGDAYDYVRKSRETFDAVFADFPHPADYGTARLYSRELYHFIRMRLAEGGFLAMDADGIEALTPPDFFGRQEVLGHNPWPIYYHTLTAAGFQEVIPYFTNLEIENRKAMELVARSNLIVLEEGAPPEALPMLIRDFLQVHTFSLQSGFILARKSPAQRGKFRGEDLPLHVLNRERYERSFRTPLRPIRPFDPNRVNSIMRPTLPLVSIFAIKLPYYGGG